MEFLENVQFQYFLLDIDLVVWVERLLGRYFFRGGGGEVCFCKEIDEVLCLNDKYVYFVFGIGFIQLFFQIEDLYCFL